MHINSMPRRVALCLITTVSSAALPALAQPALFDGMTQGLPVPEGGAFAPGDHIMHWGPMRLTAGISYTLQYNDNVFYTGSNQQWDIINIPQLNLGFYLPVTDLSSLSFGIGLGYTFYARNPDLNSAVLAPNSTLTWTIPLDNVAITFYDAMVYTPSPLVQPGLSGTGDYRTFQNTIGTRVTWSPDRWVLTGGVGYQNYFSTVSQYDYINSSSVNILALAGYKITSETQAGLQFSMSPNWFKDPARDNFISYSVGPYVEWKPLESLTVDAGGGYVIYDFSRPAVGARDGSFGSYYINFGATHQLTDHISHGLAFTREFNPGVYSQFSQLQLNNAVTYSPRWHFLDPATLFATLSYEFGNNAAVGVGSTYDRWSASIGATYTVTDRLSSSLTYQFYNMESSLSFQSYKANLITWTTTYAF